MPLLEGVRIGEARHVYSCGNSDEINPDENVPCVIRRCVSRVIRRCVPRVGRGPYNIHIKASNKPKINRKKIRIVGRENKDSRK